MINIEGTNIVMIYLYNISNNEIWMIDNTMYVSKETYEIYKQALIKQKVDWREQQIKNILD